MLRIEKRERKRRAHKYFLFFYEAATFFCFLTQSVLQAEPYAIVIIWKDLKATSSCSPPVLPCCHSTCDHTTRLQQKEMNRTDIWRRNYIHPRHGFFSYPSLSKCWQSRQQRNLMGSSWLNPGGISSAQQSQSGEGRALQPGVLELCQRLWQRNCLTLLLLCHCKGSHHCLS